MATCLSAVSRTPFTAFARATRRTATVTPTFDRITPLNMGGDLIQGGINGIGLCGQTFLAVDRSGSATNNNIYMLASVLPPGRSTTDVMFVRSTDGGQTFSAPHRINDDPTPQSKWHWFGTFSVAPNGRLDAVWYDTRNAANNIDSQLFYSWSTDGGATWAANVAVSSPFNPQAGFPQNQKIGDYITIVSDNTGGNVAYAATFNVNPKPWAGTNKMSISCAYRHRADPHLRRRPQLRPQLRRHRQPHQRQRQR